MVVTSNFQQGWHIYGLHLNVSFQMLKCRWSEKRTLTNLEPVFRSRDLSQYDRGHAPVHRLRGRSQGSLHQQEEGHAPGETEDAPGDQLHVPSQAEALLHQTEVTLPRPHVRRTGHLSPGEIFHYSMDSSWLKLNEDFGRQNEKNMAKIDTF